MGGTNCDAKQKVHDSVTQSTHERPLYVVEHLQESPHLTAKVKFRDFAGKKPSPATSLFHYQAEWWGILLHQPPARGAFLSTPYRCEEHRQLARTETPINWTPLTSPANVLGGGAGRGSPSWILEGRHWSEWWRRCRPPSLGMERRRDRGGGSRDGGRRCRSEKAAWTRLAASGNGPGVLGRRQKRQPWVWEIEENC